MKNVIQYIFVSELKETIVEMFPWCYTHSDMFTMFKYTTTQQVIKAHMQHTIRDWDLIDSIHILVHNSITIFSNEETFVQIYSN